MGSRSNINRVKDEEGLVAEQRGIDLQIYRDGLREHEEKAW